MDIMQYRRFSKASIKDTLELLKPDNGSYVYFNSGIISTYCKNGAIFSIKSPLAFFEGCLHGFQVSGITKIKKKYLDFGITRQYELELKSGHFSTRVYLLPQKDEISLKLWDTDIQWLDCPAELIQELCRMSHIADQYMDSEQPVFSAVHIVDGYLIAADYNLCRFARYKLSLSLPFDISMFSQEIGYILPRVRRMRPLRVAELEISYKESKTRGLALDFGDLRIWLPGAELEAQNKCLEPERNGGFVTYGWRYITDMVSDILRTPCQFMVIIQSPSKPPYSIMKLCTDHMSIKFMSGKIRFHYKDDQVKWKTKLAIKDLKIRTPLKTYVNPHWFLEVYREHKLMGLIDFNGYKFLYFKDKRSEQLLRAYKTKGGGIYVS